jgi:hypothetical protein
MYRVEIYHKFRCDSCEDERVSNASPSAPPGWLTIPNHLTIPYHLTIPNHADPKGLDKHLCEVCAPVFVSLANQGLLVARSADKKEV